MYTRIKKIKGISYAYLVKSCWLKRKKKPKQKTIQYLGKVYKFSKVNNKSIEEFLKLNDINSYFNKIPIKRIVQDLIKLELHNYNFEEINPYTWKQGDVIVNFKDKKIYNILTKKPACIEINNNFLSTKSFRNILNPMIPPGLTDKQIGKYLANSFLSVGILMPQDNFITLSQRIVNKVKI